MTYALDQALACAEKGIDVVAVVDGVTLGQPTTDQALLLAMFGSNPRASAAIALGRIAVVEATECTTATDWHNEHFNELGNGHAVAVVSDSRYSGPKRRWFFTTDATLGNRAIVDGVLLRTSGLAPLGEPWEWRPGNPRTLDALPEWLAPRVVSDELNEAIDTRYTDVMIAGRFVHAHRGRVLFCKERGWMVYRDGRYHFDGLSINQLIQTEVQREAAEILQDRTLDPQKRRALLNRVLGTHTVRAVEELARAHCAVSIDQLDANPWLLHCTNGVLDLRTGELRAHRQEDLITKSTGVLFDPEATSPTFDAFLERSMPDAEKRAFLIRHAGSALSGVIRDHALVIHIGGGRNGKGVWTNALLHALGDYGADAPSELLMQKRGETHPTEKLTLWGRRFVSVSETEEGQSLNVALVKRLTGGDPITARGMRQDFFTFQPTHKLAMQTNHRPTIRETKDAIWERVLLVEWTVTIPREERDPQLGEKLRKEAPGILAKLVRGCMEWQKIGLSPPASVLAATQRYRKEMDRIGAFLEEHCVFGINEKVPARDVFTRYTAWAANANMKAITQTAFGTAMGERGIASRKAHGVIVYEGLRLLTVEEIAERRAAADSESSVSSVGGEQGTEAGIVPTPPTENTTSENRIENAAGESGDSGDHVSGSSYTHAHIEMNAEGGPHTPHCPPTALGDVLARCFNLDAEGRVAFRAIASAWQEHCRNAGIEAGPDAWLSNELEARGFTFAGYNVVGLRLKEAPAAPPPTSERAASILVKPAAFHPLREFLENSFVFAHGATVAFEDVWRTWNAHAIGANLHPNTREWLREQLEEHGYDIDAVGDVHGLLAPAEGSAA